MTHFEPNTHDLAWAAGFFDGEGSVFFRGRKRKELNLTIAQADRRPLDRFCNAIGDVAVVRGPYQRNPKYKPIWVASAHGHWKTQAIVAMLWGWLSEPKREQAYSALSESLPYYKFRAELGKGNSKFKLEQVIDLRARHAEALLGRQRVPRGWITAEAQRYGVSTVTISSIVQGRGYAGKNNPNRF